jgi:hypothetical protein
VEYICLFAELNKIELLHYSILLLHLLTHGAVVLLAAECTLGSTGNLASADLLANIRVLGSLTSAQRLGGHCIYYYYTLFIEFTKFVFMILYKYNF